MADPPEPTHPPLATGDRLQKVLARIGVGSRRVCEELIVDGRVTVNGEVPVLGRRVDAEVDRVELDGVPLPVRPGLVHYLVNKPTGVVSTAEDTHGRPTVVALVPDDPRVFPVGRLDMDREGLLILTNDGELTHRLTHPSFGVPKEYLVEVEGEPTAGEVRRLREGVELDDGPTAPARVAVVAPTLLRMVIHEGRNRQIRRMCEAVGHPGGPAGPDPDRTAGRSLPRPRVLPAADLRRGPEPGRGGPAHGGGGPGPDADRGTPTRRLGPSMGLSNMPG